MRTFLHLASYCAVILCTGCGMKFSQYSGAQRSWPLSRGAIAETSFALPVYRSWPEKPYKVLGTVRCENPHQEWNDGIISQAADEAKKRGGDAIVIRYGSEFGVGANIAYPDDPVVWNSPQPTALVIKWKPKKELDEETARLQALKSDFRSKNPGLSDNNDLIDEVIKYLQQTGLALDSPDAPDRLKQVLTEIRAPTDGNIGGKWLFYCTCQRRQLTASQTDSFYGIGLITLSDNALTIVSTSPAGREVNFSGTLDKGRVSGKIGIATASIPSDGVASKEKISLSGQGQIPDGTFQTSLVFVR